MGLVGQVYLEWQDQELWIFVTDIILQIFFFSSSIYLIISSTFCNKKCYSFLFILGGSGISFGVIIGTVS